MATNEPQKFRKKPVEIEAMRLPEAYPEDVDPSSDSYQRNLDAAAVLHWLEGHLGRGFDPLDDAAPPTTGWAIDPGTGVLLIATLEGVMRAQPGDWIIRGVHGEFYPCKPDIFEATYTTAEAHPALPVFAENVDQAADVVKDMVTILMFRMHGVISSYDNRPDALEIVKAIAPMLQAGAREGILRIASERLMPPGPVLLGTFEDGKYWSACALANWADDVRRADARRLERARNPEEAPGV